MSLEGPASLEASQIVNQIDNKDPSSSTQWHDTVDDDDDVVVVYHDDADDDDYATVRHTLLPLHDNPSINVR